MPAWKRHAGAARVVELGCGVAPAAGMACLARGCDVLFTDLANVLPYVEARGHPSLPAEAWRSEIFSASF